MKKLKQKDIANNALIARIQSDHTLLMAHRERESNNASLTQPIDDHSKEVEAINANHQLLQIKDKQHYSVVIAIAFNKSRTNKQIQRCGLRNSYFLMREKKLFSRTNLQLLRSIKDLMRNFRSWLMMRMKNANALRRSTRMHCVRRERSV